MYSWWIVNGSTSIGYSITVQLEWYNSGSLAFIFSILVDLFTTTLDTAMKTLQTFFITQEKGKTMQLGIQNYLHL